MRRFLPNRVVERQALAAIVIRDALVAIIIFLAMFFPAATPSLSSAIATELSGSAETVVRQMLESISKLRTTKNSTARTELIAKIDDSLALDSLSKTALGAQWGKLGRAERVRFTHLLRELLQKLAYPEASQFFTALDVQFGKEQIKQAHRIVPTIVKRSEGGAVSIDYVLGRVGPRWRVIDIILDGQSLASNIAAQIQAVLKQGSYDTLMAQMEAKLKQPDS